MSQGLNRVQLLGNLTAETELRSTAGGNAVLKIRLATNESYIDKNRQHQERADFHTVVVFGKRGEALSRIIGKGTRIFVEGSIRTSSYDDRDGNKRYKTEIAATNVILCDGRRSAQSHDEAPPDQKPSGQYADEDFNNPPGRDDDFPF
jgi:single-strand DNA-binding protein